MLKERLVRLRGTRTQQEVADALGISRARYSHYENGRNEPDMAILNLLADYYHVTVDYLLGRDQNIHEGKRAYDPRFVREADELISLFEQEPETFGFWLDFKLASPAKRQDMIRTWNVICEMEHKR